MPVGHAAQDNARDTIRCMPIRGRANCLATVRFLRTKLGTYHRPSSPNEYCSHEIRNGHYREDEARRLQSSSPNRDKGDVARDERREHAGRFQISRVPVAIARAAAI